MNDIPQDGHHGKQAQHTPGPWTCEEGPMPDFWSIGTQGLGDITYLSLQPMHVAANARLIAAAPDLLEAAAIFAAHDWYDADLEDDNCKLTKHSGPITVGHWRKLRAAIRAATGLSNRDEDQQNSEAIVPEPFPSSSWHGG